MASVEDTTSYIQERFKRLKTTSLKVDAEDSKPRIRTARNSKYNVGLIASKQRVYSKSNSMNAKRIQSPGAGGQRKSFVKTTTATVDGSPITRTGPIQVENKAENTHHTARLHSLRTPPKLVPKKRLLHKAPPAFFAPKRPRPNTTHVPESTISSQAVPEGNDELEVETHPLPDIPAAGTPLSPTGSMTRHTNPFALAMGTKKWQPKEKDPFVKEFDMNWLGEWQKWAGRRTEV